MASSARAEAARLRRRAGQRVHAAAAVVVLVLGDVGQVREIAERAHHLIGLVARQPREQAVQLGAGGAVVLAAEAHGGLANRLNQVERGLAFLLAHAVAQQAAQEADVLAQRQVLVGGTARGRGTAAMAASATVAPLAATTASLVRAARGFAGAADGFPLHAAQRLDLADLRAGVVRVRPDGRATGWVMQSSPLSFIRCRSP